MPVATNVIAKKRRGAGTGSRNRGAQKQRTRTKSPPKTQSRSTFEAVNSKSFRAAAKVRAPITGLMQPAPILIEPNSLELPKMVKKRQRRSADVRRRVLAAALEAFGTFGYEGTSTRHVAAGARISHTLLLYHFQSKEQLFFATVETHSAPYMEVVKAVFDAAPDLTAAAALGKFIEVSVRTSAKMPDIDRILVFEAYKDTARQRWIIDHILRGHFKSVCDLIRRGQAEGSVIQCDVARLYYMILSATSVLQGSAPEYHRLTGRVATSEPELLRNIAFIHDMIFIN